MTREAGQTAGSWTGRNDENIFWPTLPAYQTKSDDRDALSVEYTE